jgi:hypothetical protein
MFQTQASDSLRIKVYKIRVYNITTDEPCVSRRMATEAGAKEMRGVIIPGTEVLISSDQLEPGEEWTALDFKPPVAG